MKLNVGAGREIKEGWTNLDRVALPGIDIVCDLECEAIPLADDSVSEFMFSHVIEHLRNPLRAMQELHRVARPDAKMTIRCPYGSSDDAYEDPTHVRQYFIGSFSYFGQPHYWKADYQYRGDWVCEEIVLFLPSRMGGLSTDAIMRRVNTERNAVLEMLATLRAVKPIREANSELYVNPQIKLAVCG